VNPAWHALTRFVISSVGRIVNVSTNVSLEENGPTFMSPDAKAEILVKLS
jgi:hypothetical protein